MTETRRQKLHGCGRCDARWDGAAMCHCSSCHATFGGVSSFDRHRAGSKPGSGNHFKQGECTDPSLLGYELNKHGTWVTPSDGVDFAAIHGSAVKE